MKLPCWKAIANEFLFQELDIFVKQMIGRCYMINPIDKTIRLFLYILGINDEKWYSKPLSVDCLQERTQHSKFIFI